MNSTGVGGGDTKIQSIALLVGKHLWLVLVTLGLLAKTLFCVETELLVGCFSPALPSQMALV